MSLPAWIAVIILAVFVGKFLWDVKDISPEESEKYNLIPQLSFPSPQQKPPAASQKAPVKRKVSKPKTKSVKRPAKIDTPVHNPFEGD